jgi:hypothetical protein
LRATIADGKRFAANMSTCRERSVKRLQPVRDSLRARLASHKKARRFAPGFVNGAWMPQINASRSGCRRCCLRSKAWCNRAGRSRNW